MKTPITPLRMPLELEQRTMKTKEESTNLTNMPFLMAKFEQHFKDHINDRDALQGVMIYVKDGKIVRATYYLLLDYHRTYARNAKRSVNFKNWNNTYDKKRYIKIA